jgi:diguanylate cyclase (GGDEF)-like protein
METEHRLAATLCEGGPTGPLNANSPVYIERSPIEAHACAEIERPGSLLRIKAPRQMGKSSLLLWVSNHAHTLGYQTCKIDFLQAEKSCFGNLDTLLRWFCRLAALQLGMPSDLEGWWDEEVGSKVSCTIYLENHLLRRVNVPLVLIINEVNQLFEYEEIAGDFLSLLRFWHEQSQRSPLWQKLRLVLAYCTDVYVPLKLEQSPFNVGRQLKLPPFTLEQVKELAERYELSQYLGVAYDSFVADLFALVGGHPYLVHTVIAAVRSHPGKPHEILTRAAEPSGILGNHLRRCHAAIRHEPKLIQVLQQLVKAPSGLRLSSHVAYQLDSLGITRYDSERYRLSCELFRRYFAAEFTEVVPDVATQHLQQENQRLQQLANTDSLTQIPNRRSFDLRLAIAWQRLLQTQQPLTLMLCDIDHFKDYNDSYGHLVGDQCLRQVGNILRDSTRADSDFVARFGGEEFAVLLPNTDLHIAQQRAEGLRSRISTQTAEADFPAVTVSIGVAVILSATDKTAQHLVEAADRVLYESKRLGRDRVTVVSLL